MTTGDQQRALARLDALRSERVGIVGLGREGIDLALFLAPRVREVVVSDRSSAESLGTALASLRGLDIRYVLGRQTASDLADCAEVFVSPGVPANEPVVEGALSGGASISSATRLFFELCPGPIIGITGSSGKTTTTTMVGEMLAAGGIRSIVGGNIGRPMLGRLDDIAPTTWCVLELSSFQLSDMTVSPSIGAILNITPNHLDRHPDMADYIRAKANMIRFQSADDIAVLNADDPIVSTLEHAGRTLQFSLNVPVEGAWFDDQALWLSAAGAKREKIGPTRLLERQDLALRGDHNVANALAAAVIAQAAGCAIEPMRSALAAFRPVPHRLEVVGTIDGVTYVNDSIATSPERSMAALRSIDDPIVLIAGGRDKHTPMEDWAQLIGQHARAVVLVGEAAPLIRSALEQAQSSVPIVQAARFDEVVARASSVAQRGDVVLLSPGCTSFDEFRDYEARGAKFRALVGELRDGNAREAE